MTNSSDQCTMGVFHSFTRYRIKFLQTPTALSFQRQRFCFLKGSYCQVGKLFAINICHVWMLFLFIQAFCVLSFWMPSSMAHFRRLCNFSHIKPRNETRIYSYVKYLIRVMKKEPKNRFTCALKYNIWYICNTNSHRCIVRRNEVCNFGSWSHLLLSHIQDSLQYLWSN